MTNEKICTWLGLPTGNWPPDHYTLLGLLPGEWDVTHIEQKVQERLARVRCYQLSHPDQATEAMNRLAQAFMCLTDPEAKRAYDQKALQRPASVQQAQTNGIGPATAPSAPGKPSLADDTMVSPVTMVDWKNMPPPVRALDTPQSAGDKAPEPPVNQVAPSEPTPATAPESPQPAEPPRARPADAVYEAAHASAEARQGLGTLRRLLERIERTRSLLLAWEQVGKYLNRTKRKLTRHSEHNHLSRGLGLVQELMEDFPRILGQPGQPGYRVIAMARLEMTPTMFNMLDPPQREALARDWMAGKVVLVGHHQFLRRELRSLRQKSWIHRIMRPVRAALNEHPSWVLLSLAALSILVVVLMYMV
jgi:hypothetical protein